MEENMSPWECKLGIYIIAFCSPSYTQIHDFNGLEYSLKPYFIDIFFGICPNTTWYSAILEFVKNVFKVNVISLSLDGLIADIAFGNAFIQWMIENNWTQIVLLSKPRTFWYKM